MSAIERTESGWNGRTDLQSGRGGRTDARSRRSRVARALLLWSAQTLLALLFLFAGGSKLVMPVDVLAEQSGLPGLFMQFIAVAELLGALGLVLPGLLRVKPGLTPLAAAGLLVIMIGATVVTVVTVGPAAVVFPLVTVLVLGLVARSRWPLLGSAGRAHIFEPSRVDAASDATEIDSGGRAAA